MIAVATDIQNEHLSPADKQFGYELGCDGMVRLAEAQQLLGGLHRVTIWSLCKRGLIRKSRIGNRTAYCRRSILNYLKQTEQ